VLEIDRVAVEPSRDYATRAIPVLPIDAAGGPRDLTTIAGSLVWFSREDSTR